MPETITITTFTLAAALGATLLALAPGVALAWLLARRSFAGKSLVETLVSLPLVLPPVATGFLLLALFAPTGPLGRPLEAAGVEIVFTWRAVVLAMAITGLPLLVRAARAGFEQVDPRYERIAATLGAGPLRVFVTISLPLAAPSLAAGAVLAFARSVGEFGATIMVAGNIPGRTTTLAVAIYAFVETGRDRDALVLVAIALVLAFLALWVSNRLAARAAPL